jgi:hypothetical protein
VVVSSEWLRLAAIVAAASVFTTALVAGAPDWLRGAAIVVLVFDTTDRAARLVHERRENL